MTAPPDQDLHWKREDVVAVRRALAVEALLSSDRCLSDVAVIHTYGEAHIIVDVVGWFG